MNICYCLLSAPQNQFKTEKKRVWLVNVFWLTNKRFIFSVKEKRKQIFVLQNSKFGQIRQSPDDIDIHTTKRVQSKKFKLYLFHLTSCMIITWVTGLDQSKQGQWPWWRTLAPKLVKLDLPSTNFHVKLRC